MKKMHMFKNGERLKSGNNKQKGFTVIELLMVVVIIGILSYVAMSAFSGNPSAANATAIRSTAAEIAKGMGYMNANLGTGIGQKSVLTTGTATQLDVIVMGEEAVAADFKPRYKAIGMRPLQSDFRIKTRGTSATTGEYSLLNYPVSLDVDTACPVARVCVVFENVPTDVVREVFTRYGYEDETKYPTDVSKEQSTPVAYTKNETAGVHKLRFSLIP